MATTEPIATFTGKSQICREFACLPMAEPLGEHEYTLELYWFEGTTRGTGAGQIEFDVPALDECEAIGIWVEDGALTDYDGTICELNPEMINLLESVGITVSEDFRS